MHGDPWAQAGAERPAQRGHEGKSARGFKTRPASVELQLHEVTHCEAGVVREASLALCTSPEYDSTRSPGAQEMPVLVERAPATQPWHFPNQRQATWKGALPQTQHSP